MTKSNISWWQKGVVYQIYPRSFQDTTGNGIGDLRGIINRLDYLNDGTPNSLGVDAIWISPFYPSPMKDFGYDVADYTNIDPMFGSLDEFDELVEEAHKRNIKIIIDWVPNHTSDEHAWFQESRQDKTNPKADWYIWRDAKPDGSLPNNWGSILGGPAWTWDEQRQQYYFHQFDPGQADLNWRNPEVRAAMLDTLRFWLDRGVDGFRMDVVYMIWKHPDMPDQPIIEGATGRDTADIFGRQEQIYSWNYEGTHDHMKSFRAVLDEYDDKVMIGEIWIPLEERMAFYGDGDEFHMPFNFDLIGKSSYSDDGLQMEFVRKIVNDYEKYIPEHGWPNYVLGNHDTFRMISRYGAENARIAAMLLLTLRGTPTMYMGDEIGMQNGDITEDDIHDPQGIRLGIAYTRDYCRTPIQWDTSDYAGFSTAKPWLPVTHDYETVNVKTQSDDKTSLLSLYKALMWLRKDSSALNIGSYEDKTVSDAVYAYLRRDGDERKLILLNFSNQEQSFDVQEAGTIVLSTLMNREENVSGTVTLAPHEGIIISLG